MFYDTSLKGKGTRQLQNLDQTRSGKLLQLTKSQKVAGNG